MMANNQQSPDQEVECDPIVHQCQCPSPSPVGTLSAPDPAPAASIKIMTWTVHCLRLERRTAEFEALTGISVKIVCIDDFDEMQAEILSDAKTRTGLWDGWKFPPAIIGQLDLLGGLHDLTPFVRGDLSDAASSATSSNSLAATLKWNDIFRFNRENGAVWDGKVVVIPLDGDVHSLYYRTDLFAKYDKEPPTTWEEYTELAKFFNGKYESLPGSNTTVKIAGSCVTRKDRPFYWTILVLSSMTQNGGTKTGALFDPDTMEPLLGEAFVSTLQYMEEQFVYGADNEFDGDFASVNIAMMNEGRCAMTYNWGDAFTEAAKAPPTSLISGYLGTAQTPGSRFYLNRKTGMLDPCTEDTCSCGTFKGTEDSGGGCINSAPYAAFTGWSGGCSSYTGEAQRAACAEFFAYVSSPDVSLVDTIPNITAGAPFISADPFRTSQSDLGQWVSAGLPEESTAEYLQTVEEQLSDPNVVLDMRIPETKAFQDAMNRAFRDHITVIKENMDAGKVGDELFSTDEKRWDVERRLRDEWNGIVERYNGNNVGSPSLLEIYQRNLGVFKTDVNYNYLTGIRAAGLTFAALVMAGSIACIAWTHWNRTNRIVRASQPNFLYLICAGTLIMGSSIIPMSIDDNVASQRGCSVACMSIPWLLSIGFTTAFSALFSKIWRLNKLYKGASTFRKVVVTEKDVLLPFAVLMTVNVALLLAWTLVDPLRWIRTEPDEFYQSYGRCVPDGNAWKVFLSLIVFLNFCALATANVQAYQARKIDTLYSESSYVMLTMASLLQAVLIGLPLLVLVHSNPTASYFVWSVLVFIATAAILLLMFVPKIILVRNCADQENEAAAKSARERSTVHSADQTYRQSIGKLRDLLEEEGIDSAALFKKAQLPSHVEEKSQNYSVISAASHTL